MDKQEKLLTIRRRKLGVLIYDARVASRKSIQECAQAVQVTSEEFQRFEKGEVAPSLPILEALAFYLNVPLEHFWGTRALAANGASGDTAQNGERLRQLRNRIIGARLRQIRNENKLSLAALAEKTRLPEEQLRQYELGLLAIPLPELEVISAELGLSVEEFFDSNSLIGEWRMNQKDIQKYLDMPSDLRSFVSRPVNYPYIQLAIRLSELSVEKLRAVAEGLLEITY
ncbi:MAG: helix-turn-helix transcriptional regulator [Chloroflexi bacterium]|nr:helix-turn-helix transcriptional regulator [Chloroflexota bacterium]